MAVINVIGEKLYQWDTGVKVSVSLPTDTAVKRVDFASRAAKGLLSMKAFVEDGKFVSEIPNEMLQYSEDITAYVVITHSGDEERTIFDRTFEVNPKEKPPGYVNEPQEILRFENLEARIKALEENSGGSTGETWTTLYDITLEEDVNTIEITTDMEGNAFKARKMRLTFIGTMTDARLNLYSNPGTTVETRNMQNTYFYQAFITDTFVRSVVEIGEKLSNGLCVSRNIRDQTQMDASFVLTGGNFKAMSTREKEFLDRIKMSLQTDKYFTAGTRILIEGVLES